jgi:NitT/TauT family transport system substrate-binding protein
VSASLPRRLRKPAALAAALVTIGALATACGGDDAGASESASEITIGYQPGLGYAPLLIAKQQKLIEKELPDVDVEWQMLDSGSALRDGVLSGDIQVAAMGTAPFLVGLDAGVEWKTLMSMNDMNLQLVTTEKDVQSLEDLPGNAKIAMPAPDSIQSVVLRKGAEKELGDATALDKSIVALGHPDGVQALVAGQIDAHLTAPPFQAQELEQGGHAILDSYDLFGEHSFNSVYTTGEFADANPELVDALTAALADAVQTLNDDPEKAAQVLSDESGGEASAEDMLEQITDEDVSFTTTPTGFETFAEFMQQIGMIEDVPATEDMFFENDYTADAT